MVTVASRGPFPPEIAEEAATGAAFEKIGPHDGSPLFRVRGSAVSDVDAAVRAARTAQEKWSGTPAPRRGEILLELTQQLKRERAALVQAISLEAGKSPKDASAEVDASVSLGFFFAGEGQRSYGRTTTSAADDRRAMTLRAPVGVAGLITAANMPLANLAWKAFPALICGNAAVLKPSEYAPGTAWLFRKLAAGSGVPAGVLQVLHGGEETGAAVAAHHGVDVVSFTGSSEAGRRVAETAARRLAKVSLELGGKNPFVVCDDADLELAARWAALSAFSLAGQRCASASRIIVMDGVYERFRALLLERTSALRLGVTDADDLGPVISERHMNSVLSAVESARRMGASVVTGGTRLTDPLHAAGFYVAPTLLEGAGPDDAVSVREIFGPVACLYRVRAFDEALALANRSPYGLTACIHTRSLERAVRFTEGVQAGTAVVNAGTYGSEPHMPFGGVKASGNGTREPGPEAMDVYSLIKTVYLNLPSGKGK